MNGSKVAVRFAMSPAGAAIDRFCVRHFAHSPVVFLFTCSDAAAYNRPLLLTTTGRRSGRPRSVVLPYFELGDGSIAIGGSRGGTPVDPHWAHNLRAQPKARVHINRRERAVRVHEAVREERDRLWPELVERSPVYARYQAAAAEYRTIPVFLLDFGDS